MAENPARKRKRPSAKEARERMARAAGSPAPISRAEETPGETPATKAAKPPSAGRGRSGGRDGAAEGAPSGRLVRLSVDVPAAQHRRLRVMAAESGATGMAVVRALLAEMETDEELAGRVRERLAGS